MTDIVERLIKEGVWKDTFSGEYKTDPLCREAADEIESLRQRVKMLESEVVANERIARNLENELAALKAQQDKPLQILPGGGAFPIIPLETQQIEPVIWIAQGHLREVSNGNSMNCYCAPEQDRFAEVPLYTSAPTCFSAGDMADAQAKAFREGVRPVTEKEEV